MKPGSINRIYRHLDNAMEDLAHALEANDKAGHDRVVASAIIEAGAAIRRAMHHIQPPVRLVKRGGGR